MKERHLKLKLADENGKPFEAVWWDGVEKSADLNLEIDQILEIAYTPEENVWRGNKNLQLVIKDARLCS